MPAMPPAGGIVVSAVEFSTAIVGGCCTSLWTTVIPRLLAGTCHVLMTFCAADGKFSTANVERNR
jgi:hypothetical protein